MLKSTQDVVLVDVRAPDEQKVSVLPGNVVLKEDFDKDTKAYTDKNIVTYWSARYFHKPLCSQSGHAKKSTSSLPASCLKIMP